MTAPTCSLVTPPPAEQGPWSRANTDVGHPRWCQAKELNPGAAPAPPLRSAPALGGVSHLPIADNGDGAGRVVHHGPAHGSDQQPPEPAQPARSDDEKLGLRG